MQPEQLNQRLSQISTVWADLYQAHGGEGGAVNPAFQRLLLRYSPAVYRYLLAAVRDPEAADELFQEFALRLVRGAFQRADPQRGRFRDFLKTALIHLVTDHLKGKRKTARRLPADLPDPAAQESPRAD